MSRTQYTIQTFTMNANPVEDRIRLDAVDASGIFQAIWITRRMANLFLPHFATRAEQQVQSALPHELVLSMDQQKLKLERADNPQPPVKAQPAITPWLCRTVHFNQRPEGLVWTLTDDATIDAHMLLAGNNLRAVLDVFLSGFRKLDWSEEAFPEWACEDATPPVPGQLN